MAAEFRRHQHFRWFFFPPITAIEVLMDSTTFRSSPRVSVDNKCFTYSRDIYLIFSQLPLYDRYRWGRLVFKCRSSLCVPLTERQAHYSPSILRNFHFYLRHCVPDLFLA